MKPNFNKFYFALSGCALISACGSTGSTGGLSDIPEVAPLVQTSLPSSLQISGSSLIAAQDYSPSALDSTYLESLFKTGSYGKISGGNGNGYINALLEDLDSRFTELKGRFSDRTPSCTTNASQEVQFDFSGLSNSTTSVDNMLKLTLDLQCNDYFDTSAAGEQSGDGSGMLFGKKDDDYSLVLLLKHQTESDSAFGYYAKVTDKGSADETVNLIFAEARPVGNTGSPAGLSSLARIMAKPQAKIYEMAIAASNPTRGNPMSGLSPNISCGFHGITNGTLVYIKAIDQSGGSSICGSAYTTELCLNATDLSAASGGVSDCATVKAAMTIGTSTDIDDWDYTDVTVAKSANLAGAMAIKTDAIQAKTSAVSSD